MTLLTALPAMTLLTALPAYADVAVPVSAHYLGSLALAIPLLIPVIAVEALIVWALLGRRLGQSFWWTLRQLTLINLVTSLVGALALAFVEVYDPEPLFLLHLLLSIGLEFLLLLRPYKLERALGKVSRAELLGASALMNLPSYALLFVLLWFNYAGPTRNPNVRSQMRSLQTLVETYAVDWGGEYPPSLEALRSEAIARNYWREPAFPGVARFFRARSQGKSMLLYSGETSRPYSIEYRPLRRLPAPKGAGVTPAGETTVPVKGRPGGSGPACGYLIRAYGHDGKLLRRNQAPELLFADCP